MAVSRIGDPLRRILPRRILENCTLQLLEKFRQTRE
jgi:hypothetical protein